MLSTTMARPPAQTLTPADLLARMSPSSSNRFLFKEWNEGREKTRQSPLHSVKPSSSSQKHVVVIGGGPVGLYLAIKLQAMDSSNFKVSVIEKYDTPTRARFLGLFSSDIRFLHEWDIMDNSVQDETFYPEGKPAKRGILLPDLEEGLRRRAVEVGVELLSNCAADDFTRIRKTDTGHDVWALVDKKGTMDPREFDYVVYAAGSRHRELSDAKDACPYPSFFARDDIFETPNPVVDMHSLAASQLRAVLQYQRNTPHNIQDNLKQITSSQLVQMMTECDQDSQQYTEMKEELTRRSELLNLLDPIHADSIYDGETQTMSRDELVWALDSVLNHVPTDSMYLNRIGPEPTMDPMKGRGNRLFSKLIHPGIDFSMQSSDEEDIRGTTNCMHEYLHESTDAVSIFYNELCSQNPRKIRELSCFVANISPRYIRGYTPDLREELADNAKKALFDWIFLNLRDDVTCEPRRIQFEGLLPPYVHHTKELLRSQLNQCCMNRSGDSKGNLRWKFDSIYDEVLLQLLIRILNYKNIPEPEPEPNPSPVDLDVAEYEVENPVEDRQHFATSAQRPVSLFQTAFCASKSFHSKFRNSEQHLFVIGDALMDPWYRFGLGVHDGWFTADVVIRCLCLKDQNPESDMESLCQEYFSLVNRFRGYRSIQILWSAFASWHFFEHSAAHATSMETVMSELSDMYSSNGPDNGCPLLQSINRPIPSFSSSNQSDLGSPADLWNRVVSNATLNRMHQSDGSDNNRSVGSRMQRISSQRVHF